MPTKPIDITSKRQLLLDPRLIEQVQNAFGCMSEPRKIGKVVGLPSKLKGQCFLHHGSVLWDQPSQKVRLYYVYNFPEHRTVPVLAESSDGVHFEVPDLDPLQLQEAEHKSIVRITKNLPQSDRMLEPSRCDDPVNMDAKLIGPAWQQAPATVNFLRTGADEVSQLGTSVRVLYDTDAVYVGFDCPGARQWDDSRTNADLPSVENLEVFIDPTFSRKDYFYFALGCYGQKKLQRFVSAKESQAQDCQDNWQVCIDRRHDGWSAVIRIPFAVLELAPDQPGCAWGFNLAHNMPSRQANEYGRYTNWSGVKAHHQPESFGALVFDEDTFKAEHQPVWEDLTSGRSAQIYCGSPCVFMDHNAPANEQYKMTYRDGGYMYAATSADGRTFHTEKIIIDSGNLDCLNLSLWDPLKQKYVVYTRWWFREPQYPDRRRGVARTESDTWLGNWPDRQVVMDPKKFPGNEKGYRDFYNPGVFVYENLYLALTTVYYRNLGWGPLCPSLMVSIDGINWQWVADGVPFINRSSDKWDPGMIHAIAPPIRIGEDLYFYYAGHARMHHVEEAEFRDEDGIGVASLPLDRFFCYHGCTKWPGQVATSPLLFTKGRQLYVNAESTSGQGRLRVEVIGDERFSAEKCLPIGGDNLSAPVSWQGASLDQLLGKPICLKFYLEGMRLYAFEVK